MTVKIGNATIGGKYPVLVQSMTNTDTNDIDASVEQCIRIARAGGRLVRLTVQGLREAGSLSVIRSLLFERGYDFPLAADVHFNFRVAEEAAKVVEKVRINPGNYAIRKPITGINISESAYREELEYIHGKISPLLKICRENGTAIRIGVNHGSLSERIINRYGDTPEGMAESAMEFIRICTSTGFSKLVVSMKASNIRVMVFASRLLARKMEEENLKFPIHLGVTEAGEGDEGRVRSAIGIAALLQQGIGDTIRVSLTEDPEKEIPVALEIVKYFGNKEIYSTNLHFFTKKLTSYRKRESLPVLHIGGAHVPVVISEQLSCFPPHVNTKNLRRPDFYFHAHPGDGSSFFTDAGNIIPANLYQKFKNISNIYPCGTFDDYKIIPGLENKPYFLFTNPCLINNELLSLLKSNQKIVLVADCSSSPDNKDLFFLFSSLKKKKLKTPVIIRKNFNLNDTEKLIIRAAGETGLFFLDGLADGIWLTNKENLFPLADLSFDILQASRARTTMTEIISCPSCGRTLFNIKSVIKNIKKHTGHLAGLKIAVMGCIVNGPGEMADADYGYIGSGPNKINLYRCKQAVLKNIPEDEAIDRLIELIKRDGRWSDK